MLWLRARLGASCAAPFAPDIQKDWLVKAGGSCWVWKLFLFVGGGRTGVGFWIGRGAGGGRGESSGGAGSFKKKKYNGRSGGRPGERAREHRKADRGNADREGAPVLPDCSLSR